MFVVPDNGQQRRRRQEFLLLLNKISFVTHAYNRGDRIHETRDAHCTKNVCSGSVHLLWKNGWCAMWDDDLWYHWIVIK